MEHLTQCDDGHWYDKSLNKECPFCGVGHTQGRKTAKDDRNDEEDSVRDDDDEEETTIAAGAKPRASRHGDRRDDAITRAVWNSVANEPTVGWLVCHEGKNQGRDYRIWSGRNVIGRDTSSQICIRGDEGISRMNHAKIFYNPRDTTFHMVEGEGRSGAYVNGKLVLQPMLLNAYDVIEIGETKLIFVPLCGPRFKWKEKPKKKEPPVKAKRIVDDEDEADEDDDVDDGETIAS